MNGLFNDRTNPDIAANEWAISDAVMRLREWGTDNIHVLPLPSSGLDARIDTSLRSLADRIPPTYELTIGAGENCALQLDDPTGHTSRLHAVLVADGTKLVLRDVSENGIKIDGARVPEIALVPGAEIGIGGVTLIAERCCVARPEAVKQMARCTTVGRS